MGIETNPRNWRLDVHVCDTLVLNEGAKQYRPYLALVVDADTGAVIGSLGPLMRPPSVQDWSEVLGRASINGTPLTVCADQAVASLLAVRQHGQQYHVTIKVNNYASARATLRGKISERLRRELAALVKGVGTETLVLTEREFEELLRAWFT